MIKYFEDEQFQELRILLLDISSKLDQRLTPDNTTSDWCTTNEAIKILNISSKTLSRYRIQGLIGFTKLSPKEVRYIRSNLYEFLNKNSKQAFKR